MSRPRALLLLAAVGLVLYGRNPSAPFQYDDHHSIARNPGIRSLANLPGFFVDATHFSESREWAMYRPLLLCTYALNYAVDGLETRGYHLANIAVHVGVAWALYDLGLTAVGAGAALAAALVFLVHPVVAESAFYVSARSDGLSLLLWLPAVAALLRGRKATSAALFGAALLAKSSAIVAPAVAWCLSRAFPGRGRGRVSLRDLAPHAVVAVAYLAGTGGLLARALGEGRVRGLGEQVLTQLEAWAYTARLLACAHPLSVEHPVDTSAGLAAAHLVAAAALASLAWLAWSRRVGCAWGLAAVLLPVLPTSAVPLNAVVSEHRLEGLVAVACLVGAGQLARAPARLRLVLAAGVLVLAARTWTRAEAWTSELTLWQSAAHVAPASARVQFFLGDVHRRSGDAAAALAALARADSLSGGEANVRLSLAGQLLAMGRPTDAAALLERVVADHPAEAGALYNLGLAVKGSAPDRAESLFSAAWGLRPELRRAAMELALLQDGRGDPVAARATLERALADSADWTEAWVNLGFVCARAGDAACARGSWTRALDLEPDLPEARANLERLERVFGGG